MAVRIRLQRFGRKHRPFYRIVVADSRTARDGKFIEKLGHYDPIAEPAEITVNEARALYWLQVGAQPSDTVKSILSEVGIWTEFMNQKTTRKAKVEVEEFTSNSLPNELLNSASEE